MTQLNFNQEMSGNKKGRRKFASEEFSRDTEGGFMMRWERYLGGTHEEGLYRKGFAAVFPYTA